MLAEDKELDRNANFHERRVDTASKSGKASEEQREQYSSESSQGFKKRRVNLDQMDKASASTAVTATGEGATGTSMDLLLYRVHCSGRPGFQASCLETMHSRQSDSSFPTYILVRPTCSIDCQ